VTRLRHQDRLLLLALLGALPATAVLGALALRAAPNWELRTVALACLLLWPAGCAWVLRTRASAPLRTLANLVEALRVGDYSLRGRRVRRDDAVGEVMVELNELGDALQHQRLAAQEAGALVQSVIEELDAAVFAFDEAGTLKLANRAAAQLLGRAAESVLGCRAAELGLAPLLAPGSEGSVTLAFPARTGRFEVQRRAFRESGEPRILLMVSDLTRALREEERRAWQRLIRVLGHEINNSLAPIRSLAGTLREMLERELGAQERRDVDESLALIHDRADSLAKFVATYSQLSRLPQPVPGPVSLEEIAQRLVALPAFRGARVQAAQPVQIEADAGQVEQVIINLLKNAFEAGAAGGAGGGVELRIERTRDGAVIEVLDEGPGLASHDNLFVPFFTTKPGGSGVGLTLSRQIVEAHGGSLTLSNRGDSGGCRARVVLPATCARTPA
jgi:nitrogen fixation/metabolism regulation signal transduction histidine kinase